jgi:hypothetical protein
MVKRWRRGSLPIEQTIRIASRSDAAERDAHAIGRDAARRRALTGKAPA